MRINLSTILLLACLLAAPSAWPVDEQPATGTMVPERLTTARAAIDAGDWRKALTELQAAERAEPRNADVHNLLGYSYRKQARPDLAKAFEHYRQALRLDPQHRGAHEYIGEAYLMDGKPELAQQHLLALEKICGQGCEEYADLAKAMAAYKAAR